MKPAKWIVLFLTVTLVLFIGILCPVLWIDPFFHYHKPHTDTLTYTMDVDYQRYLNAGILKQFDFDSLIIGTSLTEFYHASEAEQVFGGTFAKVPFSGAPWAEISDNIARAEESRPLRMVIRPLDFRSFGFMNNDYITPDYPMYLYDHNPFNDIRYLLNKETLYVTVCTLLDTYRTQKPGITSFDDYCNWDTVDFNRERALGGNTAFPAPEEEHHLSEAERAELLANMEDNIIANAKAFPDTVFYLYIPPYSIASWGEWYSAGDLPKRFEAEELLINALLPYENIRLFSFASKTEWTTDLDNYCDITHYRPELDSMMLSAMKQGECLLTEDNWRSYLAEENKFYSAYPYGQLIGE